MDKISRRFPRLQKILYHFGWISCFFGMGFIFYFLIKGTINLILNPGSQPALAPVLPGVAIPGMPTLSFWHWIVAILILATIHEFSHGLVSRLHNIKVKSSGFAFLGPILAAFVEPDEKQLQKSKKTAQLSVYAAGPFMNVITGFLFLLVSSFFVFSGVQIVNIVESSPASQSGIVAGENILMIDDYTINYVSDFKKSLNDLEIGQEVIVKTDLDEYKIIAEENPNSEGKAYLGLTVDTVYPTDSKLLKGIIVWVKMLLYWLFVASVGVGLFNLLPLGPVDGGKMLYTGIFGLTNNEKIAKRIWIVISSFCLLLIIINLLPWVYKLLIFLFKPILLLIL
ncbi:MAG: site-2 protease family protein [Candidatus Nanoarchaeia archaeon]|nr:site-2 protease family protein [Candidatus Nanoarchaeia archaeon]